MKHALSLILALFIAACSAVGLLNATVSSEGYRVERDIAYAPGPRHSLDLYLPDKVTNTTPVVVFLYGGRWQSGKKEDYLFAAQGLTSLGYVVAIPDYRIHPQVKYPEFIHDSAAAVAWVYKNIGKYGANSENLYLMGYSAGAYNAMMVALNPVYLKRAGGKTGWIRGVIGLAGLYDFLPMKAKDLISIFWSPNDPKTQPITYVRKHAPPILLLTGDADRSVNPKNSRNLYTALKKAGNNVTLKEYKGVGHPGIVRGLSTLVSPNENIRKDIAEFIANP
jgi:acetyl esterase/lipase